MFIAGNWKMNGTVAEAEALAQALVDGLPEGAPATAVFPPALHLGAVGKVLEGSKILKVLQVGSRIASIASRST